jgi:hypothetical protein
LARREIASQKPLVTTVWNKIMDFEKIYAFLLVVSGIFGIYSAIKGKSIEKSDEPKLSKNTSRAIFAVTGIVLIVFGILRLL